MIIALWAGYQRFVKGVDWADWTGFGEYTGTFPVEKRGKTLWDWLDLLIAPIILALGALWFNKQQRNLELEIKTDRKTKSRKLKQIANVDLP